MANAVRERETRASMERPFVVPGPLAGVGAAIVAGLFWVVSGAIRGIGPLTPLQRIGGVVFRDQWTQYPAGAAIVGLVLHLLTGAVWGLLFAWLTRRVSSRSFLGIFGALYGAAVFFAETYLILPWANPYLLQNVHIGLFFIFHVVYGVTLGLMLPSVAQVAAGSRPLARRRAR
jgi:hypothetical protein